MASEGELAERLSTPGSFAEFTGRTGRDPHDPASLAEYTRALGSYGHELAAARGLTAEELHDSANPEGGAADSPKTTAAAE